MALLSAWALTDTGRALAEGFVLPVSIGAGSMTSGLQTLERQTGIELLYDGDLVRELESPAVNGDLTSEAALRQLLAGTNLTIRRAASGAWIIEREATAPLAQQDAAVSEILVVGRRTQNADIRRTENDVQPYTVVTKSKLVSAHRDDVDQYFRSRVTANTRFMPVWTGPQSSPVSAIDLRGLGFESTVVLVDGRRMPGIPESITGFHQTDVNAIPLHAIDRIEILTGAAGGIHGFGALGGVVNVVLDRESRGLDLHVTQGISSRGGAHRQGVEASYGRTSNDGATDFSVFASHSQSDPLRVNQRDFALRDRRQAAALAPRDSYLFEYPHGNSISVSGSGNLVLKPELGGATLSSDRTFLPVGFSGNASALAASLTQNAGQLDISIPEGQAESTLGMDARSEALLINVRHRFGERVEGFFDTLMLRNQGRALGELAVIGQGFMFADSPASPFTDTVTVDFPLPDAEQFTSRRGLSRRYTAGLVADLPFEWRGTVETSAGSYRSTVSSSIVSPTNTFLFLLGDPSDLELNPLGDWETFVAAMATSRRRLSVEASSHNEFRNHSLRLARPVFSTAAGPATVTLLGERRTEDVPESAQFQTSETDETTATTRTDVKSRSSAISSFYAELRAPLFTHGFELQLAVRHDDQDDRFAQTAFGEDDGERVHVKFAGTAYTAGMKISPLPWLMLRGSYATGEQPPSLFNMRELEPLTTSFSLTEDPKRGNSFLGTDGAYLTRFGGNEELTAARATTAFLGFILTPSGADGPRFAIDYSRIRKTRDALMLDTELVMANEDLWPERVTRAPMTDTDRANGYTAGRVTEVDTRAMNGAGLDVEVLDARLEWPMPLRAGRLRLYADGTWQIGNAQQSAFQEDVERAGKLRGPLRWRANGGMDWTTDRLTIGANLQYFGSHLIFPDETFDLLDELLVQMQGSRKIPSQTYLDLYATWRLPFRHLGPLADLTLDLGIVNALDKAPPRETSMVTTGIGTGFATGPGYSHYGDARQRRFELVLSTRF